MKPRVLLLDDEAVRHEKFVSKYGERMDITQAYSAYNALQIIKSEPTFDEWFLDHDLGVGIADGSEFANWVLNEIDAEKLPHRVTCHSMNPVARRNMALKLKDAGVQRVYLFKFSDLV